MEQDDSRNPPEAIAALFPQSIDCGEGVVVQPFSLAVYAMLEKIGSYILEPHDPDPVEILESLYVCTHDARETMELLQMPDGRGALRAAAADWASRVPPYLLRTITAAVKVQIQRVRDVVPPPRDDKKKLPVTGGFPS